jgi:hypothetical protein
LEDFSPPGLAFTHHNNLKALVPSARLVHLYLTPHPTSHRNNFCNRSHTSITTSAPNLGKLPTIRTDQPKPFVNLATMVPATPAPYTPSESHASFMMLPTNVDGFIDLKTLADIHRFLSQSASDDDLALAAWVKDNYLYEPINVDGREIRTTEGFSKLDRAYRRVRSLTNKAQDKWPFFDRAWKSMSSTTVKNNARGEAAPGVSLLGMNNATHDSPMINGQDARGGKSTWL